MWWVGSSTMMRSAGLSCCRDDAIVLILSALEELLSSCRSNIAGYEANEFSRCCLLQVSVNVEADFGGRRGGEGFARSSLVCSLVGS